MEEKTILRNQLKTALRQLFPETLRAKSERVAAKLLHLSEWGAAEIVVGFCSLPDEIETTLILAAALQEKKTVAIPRITGHDMAFHLLSDLNAPYVVNRFGIREPASDWPIIELDQHVEQRILVIVPGLAFDRRCYRLGRGKGFYDRFLAQLNANQAIQAVTVGLCLAEQLVERVPISAHDVPVDLVVAEHEIVIKK